MAPQPLDISWVDVSEAPEGSSKNCLHSSRPHLVSRRRERQTQRQLEGLNLQFGNNNFSDYLTLDIQTPFEKVWLDP